MGRRYLQIINNYKYFTKLRVEIQRFWQKIYSQSSKALQSFGFTLQQMPKFAKTLKDPTAILNPPPSPGIPLEQKLITQKIRQSMSQILNFDSSDPSQQQLIQLCLRAPLSQNQMLWTWNQSVVAEMRKYIFMVNSTANGVGMEGKSINWPNMHKVFLAKIEACHQFVVKAVTHISEGLSWCLCERKQCKARFNPEYTKQRIQGFLLGNLSPLIGLKCQGAYRNVEGSQLFLFNMVGDRKCLEMTLSKLELNNHETQTTDQQTTAQFLKSLKIPKQGRKNCHIQDQWILKFARKDSTEFF